MSGVLIQQTETGVTLLSDFYSTGADAVQTALDRVATAADVVLTHADVVLTHADVVSTNADTVSTAADLVATTAAKDAAVAGVNAESHYTETTLAAAITAGLAATTSLSYFRATGDDVDYIGVYLDNAGTAVEKGRYTKQSALDAAVASIDTLDPVYEIDRALRKPAGWLASNSANRLVLQANGTYLVTSGTLDAYWDVPVSDDVTAKWFIDWLDVSGVIFTVEQRTDIGVSVAAITPLLVGLRRQQAITLAASTTIVRMKVYKGATASITIEPPSASPGRALTVTPNPDYLSLVMDKITALDGSSLDAGITATNATTGAILSVSGQTISVATGTTFTADFALSNVAAADFVVLLEIGTTFTPRGCTITPLLIGGGTGTAIAPMNYRWGEDNSRFLVILPNIVGGVKVIGMRLAANTSAGGGPNIGTAGAATFTLKPYSSIHIPALRSLPTSFVAEIDTQIDAKIATERSSVTDEITRSGIEHLGADEAARMIAARIYASEIATAHISSSGSDGNSGAAWEPKLTSETATTAAAAGRGVLHKRGESHKRLGNSSGPLPATGLEVGSYGFGDTRASLDSRVPLSGLTWTDQGGGRWKTTVTTTQECVMTGAGTDNSVHFKLFDCRASKIGTPLKWYSSGASIAANQSSVAGDVDSFTVYRNGSTVADPRADTSAFVYDIEVNIGGNPNGLDLRLTQRTGPINMTGGALRDTLVSGWGGKDAITVAADGSGNFPILENTVWLYGTSHGPVGPRTLRGQNQFAIGARQPATIPTNLSVLNRSSGGACHMFTAVDHSASELLHTGVVYAGDSTQALYGHISANDGYLGIHFEGAVKAFNSTTAVKFDSVIANPFVGASGYLIDRIESGPCYLPVTGDYKDGCDVLLNAGYVDGGGEVIIRSGYHTTGLLTAANSGGLVTASRECTVRVGQWGGFEYTPRFNIGAASVSTIDGVAFDSFAANYLVSNAANITGERPVFHFYGVKDNSPAGKKAFIARFTTGGGDPAYKIILHLHSATLDQNGRAIDTPIPCVLGDIADNAITIPSGLFVDAGQTFGLFNRTRAAIRTALLAGGLTAGDDFLINDETWIVNRKGALIDVPVSLGGTA